MGEKVLRGVRRGRSVGTLIFYGDTWQRKPLCQVDLRLVLFPQESRVHPLQSTKLLTTMNFNNAFYIEICNVDKKYCLFPILAGDTSTYVILCQGGKLMDWTMLILIIQLFFGVIIGLYFFNLLKNQRAQKVTIDKESKKEMEHLRKMRGIKLTEPLSERVRPATFADIVGQS